MGTYELDDDLVRRFITAQDKAGWGNAAADSLAGHLSAQVPPIPAPTKLGAVVVTEDGVLWVRAGINHDDQRTWRRAGGNGQWCHADKLPRIAKVLSEGVDT